MRRYNRLIVTCQAEAISASTSRRLRSSSRNTPIMRLVVMLTPWVRTPRPVMQPCDASITTATPCGSRCCQMQSATSAVKGTKAVKMQEGLMGVESEDADVGWAVPEPVAPAAVAADDDDLNLDDLVDDDDAEEGADEDDEMEDDDEEPQPAATGVKGKRAAPSASSSSAPAIVSVAPPQRKKLKPTKSVSFSSKPLGPTGSTLASASSSAPSAATSNVAQFKAEAGDVGLNKKAKRLAKKDKKRASKQQQKLDDEVRHATREFGPDVELPSQPRKAQTVKAAGVGGAYDFNEFFGKKARGADDDDEDM